MVKTDTQKVARLLREYAQRTSLRGGNPYRGKAYATAADNLAALSQPLERLIAAGTLTEIPGIGDAIADIITKIHQSGSHPSLDKLRKEVPEGVLELFAVPGLRPDKILKLHQELGIYATAADNLAALSQPLERLIAAHLHKAAALLAHAVAAVKDEHPEYSRFEIAGDFRRGCELVTNLAIVAQANNSSKPANSTGGLELTVTDKKHFGASLLHATGSADHLEQLAKLAADKGFALKPDGLYRGRALVASASENDIYDALGLQFIEPELREGRDELKLAAKRSLPELVGDEDLHGILHSHTTASDGTETLETMAEATRKRGFEYFGVADHSISAHYAGGLSLDEIAEQHREADKLNKRYGKSFRILKGTEADILADGSSITPTAYSASSISLSRAFTAVSK